MEKEKNGKVDFTMFAFANGGETMCWASQERPLLKLG